MLTLCLKFVEHCIVLVFLAVSVEQLREVYQWLPVRFTLNQLKLIYSTSEHGTSLSTFFNKVTGHEPTFIVIKTDQSEVSKIHVFFL